MRKILVGVTSLRLRYNLVKTAFLACITGSGFGYQHGMVAYAYGPRIWKVETGREL